MQQTDHEKLQLIYKLLQETTSISVVSDFLKTKSLPHSAGSWDDLFKKRLQPRVDDGALSLIDLINLLRSVEEYGRQHTLLYKCPEEVAISLMSRQRVGRALVALHAEGLPNAPLIFDQPKDPTLADVRWRKADVDLDLTVKEIESRVTYEFAGAVEKDNQLVKRYNVVRERCVNVAVLRRTGELEVRVTSRTGLSGYDVDVSKFLNRIKAIIPQDRFNEVSLTKAKSNIYKNRAGLAGKIRFSELTFRNDDDITTRTATGTIEADLVNHPGTVSILELAAKDGYCQSSNIWFVKGAVRPTRDIHVLLSGELNEFSINASCNAEDYQYVLDQLRELNG